MPSSGLTQGLLSIPGPDYKTKALVERLLAEDRDAHHCFYGQAGFHNHLPHHLLAAYDLGASAKVLQAIYDAEAEVQSPVNLIDRKERKVGDAGVVITDENWTEHLGPEKNYAAYLAFFKDVVSKRDVADVLEEYIFSPRANGNGASMLLRVIGLAVHPLIQIGYGIEFNDPTLVASGLAETAVTPPLDARLYGDEADLPTSPHPSLPLLAILKAYYASPACAPVQPYDPAAPIRQRAQDALTGPRPAAIRALAAQWGPRETSTQAELDGHVAEALWAATLLAAATGRRARAPRADFFLVHLLTAALFLPTLLGALRRARSRARLLRAFVPVMLFWALTRGRPRVDCALAMSYDAAPRPPAYVPPAPDRLSLGSPLEAGASNPWPLIVQAVVHHPDAHTVKAVRSLYYAAQRYGTTPPGGAPGAYARDGTETLEGAGSLDGSVFVRAAGVIMGALGWVAFGQKEGFWDRSALGWDGAWEKPDEAN